MNFELTPACFLLILGPAFADSPPLLALFYIEIGAFKNRHPLQLRMYHLHLLPNQRHFAVLLQIKDLRLFCLCVQF